MSKTKTTAEKIAETRERIQQLENQHKLLLNQQKEQERKARTKRLCKRMGLLESLLPDTIALTDEQFEAFLKKTAANEFGRKTLAAFSVQASENGAAEPLQINTGTVK